MKCWLDHHGERTLFTVFRFTDDGSDDEDDDGTGLNSSSKDNNFLISGFFSTSLSIHKIDLKGAQGRQPISFVYSFAFRK